MPLTKCTSGSKSGYRWGSKGKCYIGPDAKKKALKQGYAENPDEFKQEMANSTLATAAEIDEALDELERCGAETIPDTGSVTMDAVQAYISKKERDKVSTEDFGDPENRKYPVRNQHDLDSAARLIGRAPKSKQAAIKKRIKEIAKRKGLTIPASWQD
jgi:hypothetical protein